MGGGGASKGTTSSTTSSPYAPGLWNMAKSRFKATEPVLNQLSGQVQNALQTGGVNSGMPLINRATDAAREGSSQSMEEARQSLAKSGLGASPFGQQVLNSLNNQSSDQIAGVGPNAASQFVNMAPGIGLDMGGLQGLGNAAGLDSKTVNRSPVQPLWESILSSAASTFQPPQIPGMPGGSGGGSGGGGGSFPGISSSMMSSAPLAGGTAAGGAAASGAALAGSEGTAGLFASGAPDFLALAAL